MKPKLNMDKIAGGLGAEQRTQADRRRRAGSLREPALCASIEVVGVTGFEPVTPTV